MDFLILQGIARLEEVIVAAYGDISQEEVSKLKVTLNSFRPTTYLSIPFAQQVITDTDALYALAYNNMGVMYDRRNARITVLNNMTDYSLSRQQLIQELIIKQKKAIASVNKREGMNFKNKHIVTIVKKLHA